MQRRKFFREAIAGMLIIGSQRLKKKYLLWVDHPFVVAFIGEKCLRHFLVYDIFIHLACITCLGVTHISKNSFRNSAGKSIEVGHLRK